MHILQLSESTDVNPESQYQKIGIEMSSESESTMVVEDKGDATKHRHSTYTA